MVGHLGCGGVLAAEGAAVGWRGLGWALSVVAGLWGWLPGQEPCSGAASQAAVALRVGPELGVCLKKKLGWAGLLSTEVSPKGGGDCSASHASGRVCRQVVGQIAPCPTPVLKTKTHTSFSQGFSLFPS